MSLKRDGFEIKGYEELMIEIENLGQKANKASRQALRESAQIVQKELTKNTPKGSYLSKEHAKHNVVISNVKTNKSTGDKYITVGYPKDIKWRIHFIEFGTIRQPPKLFMTRTINNTKDAVREEIAKHLKGALDL
ncbi:HK97-gp10 family putative phage morphogenesis protein [Salinicoccus halitifaciens]|uniref:HK97 gp10 family phage protein n=1 Tax=Salinicoccus halitifaciens TaxID=1073415 RepID=A0ABV2E5P6_9STAP|nr:HK97-gp10 family putative phage morphogenesis protein [Salinicoccus halitifaciens]MCD2137171.1 HK97 gp10 family phage protein [Salinicoccus halitifaciens]